MGHSKRTFMERLGDYCISVFNYPAEDIARDTANAGAYWRDCLNVTDTTAEATARRPAPTRTQADWPLLMERPEPPAAAAVSRQPCRP